MEILMGDLGGREKDISGAWFLKIISLKYM